MGAQWEHVAAGSDHLHSNRELEQRRGDAAVPAGEVRTNAWRANDFSPNPRRPALAASISPTCFGMDRRRPVAGPRSYCEFFIRGPATTWATPQQVPGEK